ncbi:MAG TPA: hypothetical protein VH639_00010 [Bryobacteraceae bacterium]|jgi:hypothetical protein
MIPLKFTVAVFLMTAPAWAQFSREDMTKLAADRFDTAVKTLKLSADQAAAIKPLLETKYVDIGQVKDVYRASDKGHDSKKEARDSLKAIDGKFNGQINSIFTPEQAKEWKRMQKDWKDDLILPK